MSLRQPFDAFRWRGVRGRPRTSGVWTHVPPRSSRSAQGAPPTAEDPGRGVVAPRIDREAVVVEAAGRRELPENAELSAREREQAAQPCVVALRALGAGRDERAVAEGGDLAREGGDGLVYL